MRGGETNKPYATLCWRALGIRHPAFERVLPLRAEEPPGKHQGVYGSRGVSRLNPTHPRHWAATKIKSAMLRDRVVSYSTMDRGGGT